MTLDNAYETELRRLVGAFDNDLDYFAEYKVKIARAQVTVTDGARVLDFGCGIGRSLPFLEKAFSEGEITGFDPAQSDLEQAQTRAPRARLTSEWARVGADYDLVFMAGVLHHLKAAEGLGWILKIREALRPSGRIVIFEHNPWNPWVRHIVANNEVDRDAILYSRPQTKNLLQEAGFTIGASGYRVFFPGFLKGLRKLEPALGAVPVGGQYFVTGIR